MPHNFQIHDKYFKMAKERGYRARSAFKLLDVQQKFHLIRKGYSVVDLGAAPGSFMQVILGLIGEKGKVVGFDLQKMRPLGKDNAWVVQGDIYDKERVFDALEQLKFGRVDIVTSDLAPKTTGIKDVDQGLSAELTDQAFYLATQILKPGGHFLGKVFEGEDMHWLLRRIKRKFKIVKVYKPPSCRDRSFERYIVALNLKTAKINA